MDKNVKAVTETISGKIEGRYQDGLYVFKGVPYAAAPSAGSGGRPCACGAMDGRSRGFWVCQGRPQIPPPRASWTHSMHPSSRTKIASISTSGVRPRRRQEAVLVWIHGGAFTMARVRSHSTTAISFRRGGRGRGNVQLSPRVFGFLNFGRATRGGFLQRAMRPPRPSICTPMGSRQYRSLRGDPANVTVFGNPQVV